MSFVISGTYVYQKRKSHDVSEISPNWASRCVAGSPSPHLSHGANVITEFSCPEDVESQAKQPSEWSLTQQAAPVTMQPSVNTATPSHTSPGALSRGTQVPCEPRMSRLQVKCIPKNLKRNGCMYAYN